MWERVSRLARIGVLGSTSNDTVPCPIVVVTERAYVFARSTFRPSSPPTFFLTFPPPLPPATPRVILVVPLSAGARAKARLRERGRKERQRERQTEIRRHLQFAGEKDGQRTSSRGPNARDEGRIGPRRAAGGKRVSEGHQRRCQRDDETKQRENGSRTRYGSQELSPVSSEITGSRPRAHVSVPPPRAAPPRLFNVISLPLLACTTAS